MKHLLSTFALALAATFCACSGDSGNTVSPQDSDIISLKQDDLAVFEKAISRADTLNKAIPSVVALPAASVKEASEIYLCLIADSCSYDEENAAFVTKVDSSRLTKLDNGDMSFKMTDENGTLQGNIVFSLSDLEDSQNIATVKFSDITKKVSTSELDLVDENAWPNNQKLNSRDIVVIFG